MSPYKRVDVLHKDTGYAVENQVVGPFVHGHRSFGTGVWHGHVLTTAPWRTVTSIVHEYYMKNIHL